MYRYPMMDTSDWIWGAGMMVFWAIVLVALVLIISRAATAHTWPQTPINKALDIVRDRYARGEISQEEFERLKKDLS